MPKAKKPTRRKSQKVEKSAFSKAEARLSKLTKKPAFARGFVIFGLVVLALTTVFWAVLAARLHDFNADQVVDAYMFESWQAFNGAVFPGAHTFLLKWPMFALMQLFGHGPAVFLTFTLVMVLGTVAVLVYLLYRIDKRPYVFGLLCLALASILLLVPAQPYPGALLPVNMGMTTTRNLEYVLFIAAIILALRLKVLFSWTGLGAVLLFAVVIASDKLFAVLAVGGVLFAGAVHILRRSGKLNKKFLKSGAGEAVAWTVLLTLGVAGAVGLLYAIDALQITGINNGEASSPYPLINSLKELVIGLVFGALAVLTNFGANPVHEVTVLRELPDALLASLTRPTTFVYVANFLLMAAGIHMSLKFLVYKKQDDTWSSLAVIMIGAAIAAGAVYVLTDHYYPVDARYLTVAVFAVFITSAVYLRGFKVRPTASVVIAAGIVLLLPLGLTSAWQGYQSSVSALGPREHLNERVTEEVERRDIKRVVGNYWDVMPVKESAKKAITAAPVDNCVLPRAILNSSAWFSQPRDTSTAYLAIRDGSLFAGPDYDQAGSEITYGGCSLAKVVGTYGVPEERVPVHATQEIGDNPDVLLLLYPHGTKPVDLQQDASADVVEADRTKVPDSPPPLESMSDRAICSRGMTMQIIAHQDDDLLFMNPDLDASVRDGVCVRTVYLTAGDAGEASSYWAGREQGAEAAYAQMYGVDNKWERQDRLLAGKPVSVSYLQGVPEVSLVFMRLPDGNLRGQGFISRSNHSITGLLNGTLQSLPSVDSTAAYTADELVGSLRELINLDQPDTVRTQGSGDALDGDHADHHLAGVLTERALAGLGSQPAVTRYLGYPTKDMPATLAETEASQKTEIFLAYAKHDGAVCQTVFECQQTVTYGNYLQRIYSR